MSLFMLYKLCIFRILSTHSAFDIKKPLHFMEIQWRIYNTSSLKCNGFFELNISKKIILQEKDNIQKSETYIGKIQDLIHILTKLTKYK